MKLRDFKEEFRLISTDSWGDAMDAWFEVAGQLFERNDSHLIPKQWKYKASPIIGGNLNEDSYFHEIFNNVSTEELVVIGKFLFRYCQYLKLKGKDY